MLQELFKQQRAYLHDFYEHLDVQQCQTVLEVIAQHKGHLILSGVGKSGLIAQKISTTLLSTGTKACFLSPTDALHGDLGIAQPGDIALLFSKSGETRELLELLPYLRLKQVKIIAICCTAQTSLTKNADMSVILPCTAELCPFDLVPTTSAQVQLLFGDALAVGLMHYRQLTLDQYAENHPHGQIGRRATLKVRDVMLQVQDTPFCRPDDTLQDVLSEFSNKRCGCLLVTDKDKRLLGIFTDGDLRRALQKCGESVLQHKLEALMTPQARTIQEDALAWDAIRIMEADSTQPIMVLPVLEEQQGKVVGIIKMHDLIQAGI